MAVNLEPSWLKILKDEFDKDYMIELKDFLKQESNSGYLVYPNYSQIFNAFWKTPFDKIKVVLIGQDPYHGPHQAHGLSFSVQKGIRFPPSLQNIFKELASDIPGFALPSSGDLTQWAEQGVFLLNSTLTVRAATPGAHQNKGWEIFTDQVIHELSQKRQGLVFLLWGKYAQAKAGLIDGDKHLILMAAHPSPFSVYRGFYGCRHFSITNRFLSDHGAVPINWQLAV
ncbi:MAG: uracil-DNA glycosylase [Sphingobacteriaceae bacterium]